MTIDYRQANMNDLQDINLLVQSAIRVMEDNHIHQWDELYPTEEDFENDIQNGDLYVGILEEQIAVVFALNQECDEDYQNGEWEYPESPYYVIHRLCVNPVFQNRGVAARTLHYIEELLKDTDAQAIRLDVFSNNPYSQKLYAKAGYVKTGVVEWRKGKFYLMEKYLVNEADY